MTSMEALTQLLNVLNTPLANLATMAFPSIPITPSSPTIKQDSRDDLIKQIPSCLALKPQPIIVAIPPDRTFQQQLPSFQHHVTEMQEKMHLMEEQLLVLQHQVRATKDIAKCGYLPLPLELKGTTQSAIHKNKKDHNNNEVVQDLQLVNRLEWEPRNKSYANEPLDHSILTHNLFVSFKFLKLPYTGMSDPKDHSAHYNNHINILGALNAMKHGIFSMTLSRTARQCQENPTTIPSLSYVHPAEGEQIPP
ncbi:hypothetical protein GOBAR_DD00541 [Gossypium barbadense]|nr:hypothetical protein GOBAR_DD00541 [Gossypium barbadense]